MGRLTPQPRSIGERPEGLVYREELISGTDEQKLLREIERLEFLNLGRLSGSERPAVAKAKVDVCIVGAGPTGLVLAHLLQRAGVSFVVHELQEADALRARVEAGLIEHRTVELLLR